jgi:hypothetical protein
VHAVDDKKQHHVRQHVTRLVNLQRDYATEHVRKAAGGAYQAAHNHMRQHITRFVNLQQFI